MLKLAPSLPRPDGRASGWPPRPIIVTGWPPAPAMVTVWPSLTAEAWLKLIAPKLSSGSCLPRAALGASSIHSAEDIDEA